jgi:hypothetical protein
MHGHSSAQPRCCSRLTRIEFTIHGTTFDSKISFQENVKWNDSTQITNVFFACSYVSIGLLVAISSCPTGVYSAKKRSRWSTCVQRLATCYSFFFFSDKLLLGFESGEAWRSETQTQMHAHERQAG